MLTLPQVTTALQEVLTTVAQRAARTTGFVQRERKLSGATFSQTLVFGWLAHPEATLDQLAQTAATLGVALTPQALDQRFTPSAAACLQQVFRAAVAHLLATDPVALPLLRRFAGVFVQDSSTLTLPEALHDIWRGCGHGQATATAALKLQVRLELQTGQLDVQLQPGSAADQTATFLQPLPPQALRVADLGYWQLAELHQLQQQDVYWLSRLQTQTAVMVDNQRWDLTTLLATHGAAPLDLAITLGVQQRLPCRLLAIPVPQEVADQRRRRLRLTAKRKGRTVSARRLALAGWTILVTNAPQRLLSLAEALVVARLRWQIELLFKLWKSHGCLDRSRSAKPWRVLCEVYAKLTAMVLQHWLVLLGCWRYPDRSLPKAAHTVQHHASALASAVNCRRRLRQALATIQARLAAHCRMNRRKRTPNAYQLVLKLTPGP